MTEERLEIDSREGGVGGGVDESGEWAVAGKQYHYHTPLLRGWQFTPLIKAVGLRQDYKTRGFGQSTPLIKRVNLP